MPRRFVCLYDGCPTVCKSRRGLTYHTRVCHLDANRVDQAQSPSPPAPSPLPLPSPPLPSSPLLLSSYPSSSPHPSPPTQEPTLPTEAEETQEQHTKNLNPFLDGKSLKSYFLKEVELMVLQGLPCDTNGNTLPPGTPPALRPLPDTPWAPFVNWVQFKTADFLFRHAEMSAGNIEDLLDLCEESMENSYNSPPFNHMSMSMKP